LAALNRDAYLPDLAGSVNNHAISLAAAGRRGEALTVSEEALTLYRELAARNRDAYRRDLATSLRAHAWVRHLVGADLAAALATAREAVDAYTELAGAEPAAFGDRRSAARRTLADVLESLGRGDEAAEIRQALDDEAGDA
jgi:hypothetical protein